MATTQVKDGYQGGSDNQLKVNSDGSINVDVTGGGGSTTTNLTEVGGAAIALGQATASDSLPVVLASNQSPIPISGTVTSSGTSTVSGTVNTNVNGLNVFQTSQYSVGTSAVQITPTPLTNRSSMSVKAVCSSTNAIYIGNSNAVTTSTGFPLFNGDVINLDLTGSNAIWAIASAAAQTLYVMELAD